MGKWIVETPHKHDMPRPAKDYLLDSVWECRCGKEFKVGLRKIGTRTRIISWLPVQSEPTDETDTIRQIVREEIERARTAELRTKSGVG